MTGVLERILALKRMEIAESARRTPIERLRELVRSASPPRGFAKALEPPVSGDLAAPAHRVIAEVKKASPSKGVIREDFDPVWIARAYERGGATAISVLTDEPHFQGKLEYLTAIRSHVSAPLLRKDFIVESYQIWEARAAGADAILLILAALPEDPVIAQLKAEAEGLGMDILWEVHDLTELRRLLRFSPKLVGVNNRDLRTFEVTLETTRKLLPEIPGGSICVSESGFSRREELDRMRSWGVGAFLIGESLMRAPDPGEALRDLLRCCEPPAAGAQPSGTQPAAKDSA